MKKKTANAKGCQEKFLLCRKHIANWIMFVSVSLCMAKNFIYTFFCCGKIKFEFQYGIVNKRMENDEKNNFA